jgi:hypothetical protein
MVIDFPNETVRKQMMEKTWDVKERQKAEELATGRVSILSSRVTKLTKRWQEFAHRGPPTGRAF